MFFERLAQTSVSQVAVQNCPLNAARIGGWAMREKVTKDKRGLAGGVFTKSRSHGSTSFSDVAGRARVTGDKINTTFGKTVLIMGC